MSIHTPRPQREQWGEWGARVYGTPEQWRALKAKYWASRWTIFRRCLICRSGKDLQLNHLTYRFTKLRAGWTPLLLLVPLCPRCHKFETWLTRRLRKLKINFGEHVIATFGTWAVTRSGIVALVWYLLVLWPGVPGPAAIF
jgi:5-methylcytosine-specific restriction endonuclease McrA